MRLLRLSMKREYENDTLPTVLELEKITTIAFTRRRQTMSRIFRYVSFLIPYMFHLTRCRNNFGDIADDWLVKASIDGKMRPENVETESWIKLTALSCSQNKFK